MDIKTCCVTDHRDIPADQLDDVKNELRKEIERAIAEGYTCFLSGFAEGADQCFAEIVAQLRQTNPILRLEAAIPYRKRYFRLLQDNHAKSLLDACTDTAIISEDYAPDVFMLRNRYMADRSGLIIAVYDGRKKGGTAATLRYAKAQQKQIREITINIAR